MVGVAVVQRVGQHHGRTQPTDGRNHQPQGGVVHFEEPVGEAEVFTVNQPKDLGGLGRFLVAELRGASSSQFAAGQVDHSAALALAGQFGQGGPCGQFHVVGVGPKGQHVHRMLRCRHAAKVLLTDRERLNAFILKNI